MAKKRIGELLVEAGLIDEVQLRAALGRQRQWGKRLGTTLVSMGMVREDDVVKALSAQSRLPTVELANLPPDPVALALLDEVFCREHDCLPLRYEERGKFVDIAIVDPTNQELFDEIRLKTRCNPRFHIAGATAIGRALRVAYGGEGGTSQALGQRSVVAAAAPASPIAPAGPAPATPRAQPRDDVAFDIDIDLEESSPDLILPSVGQPAPLSYPVDTGLEFVHEADAGSPMPTRAPGPAIGAPAERAIPTDTVEELRRDIAELREAVEKRDQVIDKLVRHLADKQGGEESGELGDQVQAVPKRRGRPFKPPPTARADGPATVAMDFGTTRSSVGVMLGGKATILKLPPVGGWDMPSVVGFRDDGSVMLGDAARHKLATDPVNAIASPKRLLGRSFRDRQIEPYLASTAMPSREGPHGEVMLQAQGKEITVEEVCAHVLNFLRLVAQRFLKREVIEAVLTTPVEFGQQAYEVLARATELAGIEKAVFRRRARGSSAPEPV